MIWSRGAHSQSLHLLFTISEWAVKWEKQEYLKPRASKLVQTVLQNVCSLTNNRTINIITELPALQECYPMNYCEYLKFTSAATMFISSVNRKQSCERDESGTVSALVVRNCPGSLYCHPENRVKCLWTKINSVVTFFPRINQLILMDATHWKDLSLLIFLRRGLQFLSGGKNADLSKPEVSLWSRLLVGVFSFHWM